MTENTDSRLNQHYKAAQIDSTLAIRFIGNTAQISDMKFINIDPFQMIAAAEYLKMKAFQMIQQSEIDAAKKGLVVPKAGDNLPPSGFVKG